MPIYEYHCDKCDTTFEIIQKFSDAPLTQHADCGGHVQRLLSAPGFHFKGSGWYVTDYGRSGGAQKSDTNSESKSESKAESKPETKTESKPAPAAKSE